MGIEATREWKGMQPRQKIRMLETQKNGSIVDGAILATDGVDVSHRLMIVPRKTMAQQRYARNRSIMGLFAEENGGYVSALFESCITMAQRFPSLSQSDIARLMFIGTYTGYSDGRLRHDNGTTIDRVALLKLTGMSRARYSEFYGRLLVEDVIREAGNTIIVNPTVFQRGESVDGTNDLQRIRLYRQSIRELYEQYGKGRDVKQLAIVFTIIPFLHFSTNVVCFNPQEYNIDQIQPMTVDKLAAMLNYAQTSKLKAAMNNVKLGGRPVFVFVEDVHDKRKRRIVVNPRVVFAGNADGLTQLRAISVLFN
ncbi:hypothetical protein [Cohnella lupini]|uniref:Uncharacterized protein n=1 Tax=Cohnella lupini TaxID=1294267 RepID=A0A3D9I5Z1_9BACL|nr:hypothetical protein [Cohnella lupini]RED57177.1 hypothetical protein DFP95_11191 [Cohnella lupini]